MTALDPAERFGISGDEAREPELGGVRVASEHDVQAAAEPELPCVTRREHDPLEAGAERRHQTGEMRVAPRDFPLRPGGPQERRQHRLAAPGKALAVGIDQRLVAPARERNMFLHRNLDPVGPDAAHRDAPDPWQLLDGGSNAGELDGEEIAGDAAAYGRLDLLPGGVLQAVIDLQFPDRKERRAKQELQSREREQKRGDAEEQPGRRVEQPRVIPHARPPGFSGTAPRTTCPRRAPPSAPANGRSCRAPY